MKRLSGQPLSTAAPWERKGQDMADGVYPPTILPSPALKASQEARSFPLGSLPSERWSPIQETARTAPEAGGGVPGAGLWLLCWGAAPLSEAWHQPLILRSHPDGFILGEGSKYEVTNRKKSCRQNQEKLHRLLNLWVKGFPPTCARSGDFSSPGVTVTHARTTSHLQRKRTNQPHDVAPEIHGAA